MDCLLLSDCIFFSGFYGVHCSESSNSCSSGSASELCGHGRCLDQVAFQGLYYLCISLFRQEEASPASVTRGGQQDPVHQLVKWTWTNVLLDRHPAPGIPWWRASMCLGPSTVVLAPLGTLEMASTALMRMNAGQATEGAVSVQGWNASTPVVVIIVGPVRLDILGMGGLADTSGHVTFPMEVVTHWPLALSRLAWSGASALLAMEVQELDQQAALQDKHLLYQDLWHQWVPVAGTCLPAHLHHV